MTRRTGTGLRAGAGRTRQLAVRLPLVLLLAGCSADRPSGTGVAEGTDLPALDVDPGVVHVHGLGVDPRNGVLYAATHSGLFRISDDRTAVRVANRAQDTMGFTISGSGRFLASGHPDFREDPDLRPPHLGLIESTDQGRTWTSRSLRGVADFHVLHARHDRIYGYDSTSGTLRVSPDGKTWQNRSVIVLNDVEVSPDSPDTLVGTDGQSLRVSTDGGRSWQQTAVPAPIGELSWAPDGTLYGVTVSGRLLRSDDTGRRWTSGASRVGVPEALLATATPGELFLAVVDGGIVRSTDGGFTFTSHYRPASPAAQPMHPR